MTTSKELALACDMKPRCGIYNNTVMIECSPCPENRECDKQLFPDWTDAENFKDLYNLQFEDRYYKTVGHFVNSFGVYVANTTDEFLESLVFYLTDDVYKQEKHITDKIKEVIRKFNWKYKGK